MTRRRSFRKGVRIASAIIALAAAAAVGVLWWRSRYVSIPDRWPDGFSICVDDHHAVYVRSAHSILRFGVFWHPESDSTDIDAFRAERNNPWVLMMESFLCMPGPCKWTGQKPVELGAPISGRSAVHRRNE
jgi:hypothetical protein